MLGKEVNKFVDLIVYDLSLGKLLLINECCQFLVNYIVFKVEKVLHELLLYLQQPNVVNLSVGIEPFQMSKDLIESSSPVSRIFKLIFHLGNLLSISSCCFSFH